MSNTVILSNTIRTQAHTGPLLLVTVAVLLLQFLARILVQVLLIRPITYSQSSHPVTSASAPPLLPPNSRYKVASPLPQPHPLQQRTPSTTKAALCSGTAVRWAAAHHSSPTVAIPPTSPPPVTTLLWAPPRAMPDSLFSPKAPMIS